MNYATIHLNRNLTQDIEEKNDDDAQNHPTFIRENDLNELKIFKLARNITLVVQKRILFFHNNQIHEVSHS